jgi:hypothetical protein
LRVVSLRTSLNSFIDEALPQALDHPPLAKLTSSANLSHGAG